MSLIELQQFIGNETVENPALSVEEGCRCPVCGFLAADGACPVCGASLNAKKEARHDKCDERDYLERAFASADVELAFDPFRTVASTVELSDHLKQQARMSLGGRHLRIAEYLIDSLDADGYFRESLFETAEQFGAAVPEVESVLAAVQTFDPPGIAAKDLRECLSIQLRASGGDTVGSNAERIVMDYWQEFSKVRHKAIAKKMGVPMAVVREACGFIRDRLTPRPAANYRAPFGELSPRENAAVAPDVVLRKRGDSFLAEAVDYHERLLNVDQTYEQIYESIKTSDPGMCDDDRKHIVEHVERVRSILEAIGLRKKTVTRVAAYLAEYQSDFLENGPSYLKPLRQKDVAKALGVHESTVCRAVAGKYCRLPSGEMISFDVFFDSALPVRNMIRQLIARSAQPLSDSEIASKLAEQGVTIARRTVAKYREQLGVLPYQLRAA